MSFSQSPISHFAESPSVSIERSKFKRPSQLKTTFREGDLVPLYLDEVLPGDTCSMDVADVVRMTTPIFPVFDNAYLDLFAFFVPNRLTWEHWRDFMGENRVSPWAQQTTYEPPAFDMYAIEEKESVLGQSLTGPGSLWDYFGLPKLSGSAIPVFGEALVNTLPFRGYALIWNEFFRDQNLQSPIGISTGDVAHPYDEGLLIDPLKVAKYHDYFTSCLPAPQKGPSVLVPLTGFIPVVSLASDHAVGSDPIRYVDSAGQPIVSKTLGTDSSGYGDAGGSGPSSPTKAYPSNLFANLSNGNVTTINALRLAFQTQKLLERDTMGTRYTELLAAHFGVTNPDSRLQRPEYLGGAHQLLNMDQVLQTSQTTSGSGGSPQGNASGFSKTSSSGHLFTHSFTEHGYLFILGAVRTQRTYQQGIDRHWSRRTRLSYYFPELAHIGNQPVYNREIFCTGTASDHAIFGYQEAWADYRYKPSRVTGMFRSGIIGSLDAWHYADYYSQLPTLSASWISEDDAAFKRTLAIQSSTPDQFIGDFLFDGTWTRPMPVYSVPGLVDHF